MVGAAPAAKIIWRRAMSEPSDAPLFDRLLVEPPPHVEEPPAASTAAPMSERLEERQSVRMRTPANEAPRRERYVERYVEIDDLSQQKPGEDFTAWCWRVFGEDSDGYGMLLV
jgi:hypothetical protein